MKNKVIIISGIARGIGEALAILLAEKGAIVVGFDVLEKELQTLEIQLKKIGADFLLDKVDITKKNACKQFVETTLEKFGKMDGVINSAGVTHIAPAEKTNLDDFDRLIQINLLGTIYLTQLCLPFIVKQQGFVVGISSVAGYSPLYYRTAYAASKYGVWGYLETLQAEMKEKKVLVMTVCPSYVETKLQESQQKYFSNNTNEALSADFVAEEILKGINKRKTLLFVGKTSKRAYWIHKLFPRFYERVMIKKTKLK